MRTITATAIAMLIALQGADKAHEMLVQAQADATAIQSTLEERDAFIESLFEDH